MYRHAGHVLLLISQMKCYMWIRDANQVAKELSERGVSADYYHADMDANAREGVHMR